MWSDVTNGIFIWRSNKLQCVLGRLGMNRSLWIVLCFYRVAINFIGSLILEELVFAIVKDWFFLLAINFCDFQEVALCWIPRVYDKYLLFVLWNLQDDDVRVMLISWFFIFFLVRVQFIFQLCHNGTTLPCPPNTYVKCNTTVSKWHVFIAVT